MCTLSKKMERKGIIYAIMASVLWAIVTPFIKHGLSFGFAPLNFAGLRFTIVGILLLIYTARENKWNMLRRHRRLFLNLIFLNIFLGYTAFYYGVDMVRADISSIVIGITPLINVLLAHFVARDDKLNKYKIGSIVISFFGIILIVGAGNEGSPLSVEGVFGILLILASIVVQGFSAIMVSEEKDAVNPVFLNGVQMFFGGLLLYATGIAAEGFRPFIGLPMGFYVSLGVLVLVSTFAFSFWFIALRCKGSKVSNLNMARLINPILGAVMSWVLLADESPSVATAVGIVIIVAALVVYFRGESKKSSKI